MPVITILPQNICTRAAAGTILMQALRDADVFLDAPCGGRGKCGKCAVIIDGEEKRCCQTTVETDLTVTIPEKSGLNVLSEGMGVPARFDPVQEGYLLAVDIGTTSVVCYLLDRTDGRELASASALNAQAAFGADVISRIRAALGGELERERDVIRSQLSGLIEEACREAGADPGEIGVVSVVGNPAMQQLFLGISPRNLAAIPFAPVLTEAGAAPCRDVLPICENAQLLIVPDIAGYIGADTLGCVLSTKLYEAEELTLLVDIGTNGEMVLGDRSRMIACSTAAGPALEGACIRFGMRGTDGAIDHVRMEDGSLCCSVIGGGEARGICGSGLIDAAAVLLENGMINRRGRITAGTERDGQRIAELTDTVYLTQEDIRQLQMAKGAICAGIRLMAEHLGHSVADIRRVLLAGAFGSYLDPDSACRIGLLPEELRGRITAVGNAAGSGARLLACDRKELDMCQELTKRIGFLELASLPEFSGTFARAMTFREIEK